MNLATMIVGPLIVPECARSARRGWGLVIRSLAAAAVAAPSLAGFWWWWMSLSLDIDYQPGAMISIALVVVIALQLLIAIVLSPAVLAGSLAGEKERGSIGLLLSTRVDAREIVLGRLFGKLSLIYAMLLAGWPFVILLAVLGDLSTSAIFCVLAIPVVLAFGIGGLAIAVSAIARRGRNALIAVYLIVGLLLIGPGFARWGAEAAGYVALASGIDALNPFASALPLGFGQTSWSEWICLAFWSLVGVIGVVVASFQLRPSFLALVGGATRGRVRRCKVPAVDDARPMLWKELYIERVGALGWFGRVLGTLLILYLVVGTMIVGGIGLGSLILRKDPITYERCVILMSRMYEDPAFLISILIQLAIGLRAAVTISSERERGTWDALLTSPLSGQEILGGKLWGSLYALRYFLTATLFAWGVSLGMGAMALSSFLPAIVLTVLFSAFIAAIGVRASLSSGTATKAMSITIGTWLASGIALSILCGLIVFIFLVSCFLVWLIVQPLGLLDPANTRPWLPTYLVDEIWHVLMGIMCVVFTAFMVMASRSTFDKLAGRLVVEGYTSLRPAPVRVSQEEPEETVAG